MKIKIKVVEFDHFKKLKKMKELTAKELRIGNLVYLVRGIREDAIKASGGEKSNEQLMNIVIKTSKALDGVFK